MAQGQKHWVQAMLHEETYIPYQVTYDVTSWSNPLLLNLQGGWTGDALTPRAVPVGPTPAPSWDGDADLPRVGLFEIPNSSRGFESAGQTRYVFENMWRPAVPLGDSGPDRQRAQEPRRAGGPRWLLQLRHAGSWVYWQARPEELGCRRRALRRVAGRHSCRHQVGPVQRDTHRDTRQRPWNADPHHPRPDSPLAAGVGSTVWVMYDNNDTMTSRYSVGEFPAPGSNDYATSGLAERIDELSGTSIVADEPLRAGRVVTFAIDPNFRAWTLGTHRLLWNAITGPDPASPTAARLAPAERAIMLEQARAAERRTPEIGDAIRIAVPRDQSAAARAAIRPLGLQVRTIPDGSLRIITVANVEHLGLEESRPLSLVMSRVQEAGVTIEWASLPGP